VKRGEVWWHEPPDTRDEAIKRLFDVVAVPATGTIRGTSTEVQIGVDDGMPIECVLGLDNTLSAEKTFLTTRITTLGPEKLDEVCKALAVATSCR
jgi:mRNA interferase MazF